jgi:polyphenol oxidase
MVPEKIVPDIFDGLPVSAFFTTRAFSCEVCSCMAQLNADYLYLPIQKHTGKVIIVDSGSEPETADAVVTRRKGLAIGVRTADCVPILLYDREKGIAAAVHAGWRGTAEGILGNAVSVLCDSFSSSPGDIVMAVGPCIQGECYAVSGDVVRAVSGATGPGNYFSDYEGSYYLDLPAANRLQALAKGVLPENIWLSGECTHCLSEKYHSYRRSGEAAGRQVAYITIR